MTKLRFLIPVFLALFFTIGVVAADTFAASQAPSIEHHHGHGSRGGWGGCGCGW